MLAGPPKQIYTRAEAIRLAGTSERRLRRWEEEELVPRLAEFAFTDLLALRSLEMLRQNRVTATTIRRAVNAVRQKLAGVSDPLKQLKIFCEGRKVAVLFDGRKLEAISGQLLLDFDSRQLSGLLAFPGEKRAAAKDSGAARRREAERWFEKGLELEQTGAPLREIVEAYEKAVSLDPESAGAMVNLGTIHFHLRSWDEAEKWYKNALTVDPEYALAHFNLGNLFDEKGDRREAMAHYLAALRINPNYADAHYNFALLCQTQGDLLKAVRHWKLYLKLDPRSSWAVIAKRELDKLTKAAVVTGTRRKNGAADDARTR